MSTDEITAIHKRLDNQDHVLQEIRSAIVGNSAMGTPGLASRLKDVEEKANSIDRKLLTWGGLVSGAVIGTKVLIDKVLGS